MSWHKYLPQSIRAAHLAHLAHEGQTDLEGNPYRWHLHRVAKHTETAEEAAVAWLHDIIEDTPLTANDLRAWRFSERVVEAVLAITRPKSMEYPVYTEQVLANELATTVKQYDLLDHVEHGTGAEGSYGDPDWKPPDILVGHPKLPVYVTFLERLGFRQHQPAA